MRLKIWLLWALLTPFWLSAQNDSFQFSNLSVKDGLSQNTVIRILQDSKNFMWFCTRNGLNRYDGTSFKVYRSSLSDENSISSSDVTSISENKNGAFWIGTHNGLNYYDPKTEQFKRYFHSETDKNSVSSSTIKLLLNDKSDNTWISTTKGLDLFDKKTNSFKHIYTKDAVIWVIQRANGDICFASVRDGFYVYNSRNGQLINYPLPANDYIYTLFEDSNNDLWAGMWPNSLKKFNPDTKSFEQVSLTMGKGIAFDHEQIGYMVESKPGKLMLATRKGLLIYDTKLKVVTQRISTKNSQLRDEKVITLYKDKAGSVWIGSWNGGIDFYSPYSNYFNLFTPMLAGKELVGCINSISEINGLVWLATDNGLLTYNRQANSYQLVPLNLSSTSNEVKLIYRDNDKLWVSIYAGGLHILNVKSQRIERTIPNFNYGYVKAMTKDAAGNYWIATGTNDPFLMLDSKTNSFKKRFEIKGSKQIFAPINVQDVMLENGQTVWIGTRSDGLYRYNYQTKQLIHHPASANKNALSNNHVSVLFKDSRNKLWVGTYGGGICLYDSKTNRF